MRKVALYTTKGGAGKSTTAAALASFLHIDGRRAAIIDCDPQGSSYAWKEAQGEASRLKELPVFHAETKDDINQALRILEKAEIEWVFIDVPGVDDPVSRSAAAIADVVLVPLRPGAPDLRALKFTLRALKTLNKPFVIGLNAVNKSSKSAEVIHELLDKNQLPYLMTPIHHSVVFERTHADGETPFSVNEYSPAGINIRNFAKELIEHVEGIENGA